jgi:hypothetical protein
METVKVIKNHTGVVRERILWGSKTGKQQFKKAPRIPENQSKDLEQ